MRENVAKLQIRYPAGFSVADSENRSYEKESVAFQQSPVETTTSPVEASLMRAAAQVAPVPSLLDLTWRQGQLVYLDVPLLAVINVNGQFRRSDLQARLRYVFTTVKGWTPGESSWENFVDETCGKLRSVGYQQIDE